MKNPVKKTLASIRNVLFFKTLPLALLVCLFLATSFVKASNSNPTPSKLVGIENNIITATTNPIYNELFNRIKNGECFKVKVSSVSTKNNNYAFVSYAQGFLQIQSGYNIAISRLQTEFDDRKNFQGPKTIENLVIYKKSSRDIGMTVNMKNWGNKTIKLQNVKITKERFGYFITGKATDGNRTVYYTLGIYKTDCLI